MRSLGFRNSHFARHASCRAARARQFFHLCDVSAINDSTPRHCSASNGLVDTPRGPQVNNCGPCSTACRTATTCRSSRGCRFVHHEVSAEGAYVCDCTQVDVPSAATLLFDTLALVHRGLSREKRYHESNTPWREEPVWASQQTIQNTPSRRKAGVKDHAHREGSVLKYCGGFLLVSGTRSSIFSSSPPPPLNLPLKTL